MNKKEYIPAQPVHPSEYIKDFMENLEISFDDLIKKTKLNKKELLSILNKEKDISIDIAMKLEKIFNVPTESWLKIQEEYHRIKFLKSLEKQANTPQKKRIVNKLK